MFAVRASKEFLISSKGCWQKNDQARRVRRLILTIQERKFYLTFLASVANREIAVKNLLQMDLVECDNHRSRN